MTVAAPSIYLPLAEQRQVHIYARQASSIDDLLFTVGRNNLPPMSELREQPFCPEIEFIGTANPPARLCGARQVFILTGNILPRQYLPKSQEEYDRLLQGKETLDTIAKTILFSSNFMRRSESIRQRLNAHEYSLLDYRAQKEHVTKIQNQIEESDDDYTQAQNAVRYNRPLSNFRVRRVFGLFWPLFDLKLGGNILLSILPPNFKVENRLKRTEKSTEPEFRKRSNVGNCGLMALAAYFHMKEKYPDSSFFLCEIRGESPGLSSGDHAFIMIGSRKECESSWGAKDSNVVVVDPWAGSCFPASLWEKHLRNYLGITSVKEDPACPFPTVAALEPHHTIYFHTLNRPYPIYQKNT